jgi:hypothetical protein
VVLLGPSGAGKSSVLQAVVPALAAGQLPGSDRWITVVARPGKDLLAELDRAGPSGVGVSRSVTWSRTGWPANRPVRACCWSSASLRNC